MIESKFHALAGIRTGYRLLTQYRDDPLEVTHSLDFHLPWCCDKDSGIFEDQQLEKEEFAIWKTR